MKPDHTVVTLSTRYPAKTQIIFSCRIARPGLYRLLLLPGIVIAYNKIDICFSKEESMISGRYSSFSGLRAYGLRLQSNANNVANMNTDGFKKGRVLLSEEKPQGVSAVYERVDTPGPLVAEETAEGTRMVEQSNVDLAEEFTQMNVNKRAFQANIRSLQAVDEMENSLLDLKA